MDLKTWNMIYNLFHHYREFISQRCLIFYSICKGIEFVTYYIIMKESKENVFSLPKGKLIQMNDVIFYESYKHNEKLHGITIFRYSLNLIEY